MKIRVFDKLKLNFKAMLVQSFALLLVGHMVLADKPNIVLILADDMGPGELSHMGSLVQTPALDQMAKEGIRFTDGHSSSSVCTPTRYSILAGRYNWRSSLKRGVLVNVDSKALMDPNRLNLPKFLQNQGYYTGMVGKWHLGVDWEPTTTTSKLDKPKTFNSWKVNYSRPFKNGPVDIGFDEAFFLLASLDMPPYLYLKNRQSLSVPDENQFYPHNEYNDYHRLGAGHSSFDAHTCLEDFARESREFIQTQAEGSSKPFFLYLPLTSPHTPVTVGKKFKGKHPQFSHYADFITETDWVVGQVLKELKESDIDKNTIVIYTSDNGFAPYVKIPKMLEAGYKPSGPYRSAKASIYEGGHRVPFIVRWPAKVKGGLVSDATVCTTDFFATFADILNVKDRVPDNAAEDSFSFYSSLMGKSSQIRPYTVHHSISGVFAIRKGDWKLILSTGAGGGWDKSAKVQATHIQLYNLKEDVGETINLETQYPERVKELVGLLAKSFHDGRSTPGAKQLNDGWPIKDKKLMELYPELKESE